MTLEDVEAFRLRHRPNEGNVPARTQTRASLKSAVAPIPPQDWHNGLDWDDTPLEELRKLPQNFSESYHTVLYGRVTDHHFEQAGFRALLRD